MATTLDTRDEAAPSQPMGGAGPSVDKSPRRMRQMFGEISGRYDLLNHLLSGNADRYWRWRTVRALRPLTAAPILDVCTGTGDLALALTHAAPRGTRVIGADFCRPMLSLASEKAVRRRLESLQFVEADAQFLPFEDDMFQAVSVAFGLRNVADLDQGLREMTRVCRPGGKVAVLEFSLPEQRLLRAGYQWYFRNVLPRIGQALARNRQSAYHYLPQSVQDFPQGESLATRMRSADLRDVWYRPLTFGVATLYVGTK